MHMPLQCCHICQYYRSLGSLRGLLQARCGDKNLKAIRANITPWCFYRVLVAGGYVTCNLCGFKRTWLKKKKNEITYCRLQQVLPKPLSSWILLNHSMICLYIHGIDSMYLHIYRSVKSSILHQQNWEQKMSVAYCSQPAISTWSTWTFNLRQGGGAVRERPCTFGPTCEPHGAVEGGGWLDHFGCAQAVHHFLGGDIK